MWGAHRRLLAIAVCIPASCAFVVGRVPSASSRSQLLGTVQADATGADRPLRTASQHQFAPKRSLLSLPTEERHFDPWVEETSTTTTTTTTSTVLSLSDQEVARVGREYCAASYMTTVNGTDELEKQRLISKAKTCVANEKLLFLHIPKNVGTTIEDVAMSRGIHWGKFMDFNDCPVGPGNCYANWHEPPALMAAINVYTATKVFCVVRNPYQRAVSEYKFIYANPEYRWDNNELVEQEGCSKEGLNTWLTRVLQRYLDGNIYDQLCHLLPQAHYIWGPPDTWGNRCQYCHEILRQEEFPGTFNNLMERYGYDVRLSSDDHLNMGGCPDLSIADLSLSNIEMIQTIYANDFKWLNYSSQVS